jgi:hypothetical protein
MRIHGIQCISALVCQARHWVHACASRTRGKLRYGSFWSGHDYIWLTCGKNARTCTEVHISACVPIKTLGVCVCIQDAWESAYLHFDICTDVYVTGLVTGLHITSQMLGCKCMCVRLGRMWKWAYQFVNHYTWMYVTGQCSVHAQLCTCHMSLTLVCCTLCV